MGLPGAAHVSGSIDPIVDARVGHLCSDRLELAHAGRSCEFAPERGLRGYRVIGSDFSMGRAPMRSLTGVELGVTQLRHGAEFWVDPDDPGSDYPDGWPTLVERL